MAKASKPTIRDNNVTTPASTRKLRSASKIAMVDEASFEACHKVLETAELLEMILLFVYNPYDHFRPKVADHAKDRQASKMNSGSTSTEEDGSRSKAGGNNSSTVGIVATDHPQFVDMYDPEEALRDMKTLLLSQRVDRMFKTTITGSRKLQQALWQETLFDPRDLEAVKLSRPEHGSTKTNPLLERGCQDFQAGRPGHSWYNPTICVTSSWDDNLSGMQSWRDMLVAQAAGPVKYNYDIDGSTRRSGPVAMNSSQPDTAQSCLNHAVDAQYELEDVGWDERYMVSGAY